MNICVRKRGSNKRKFVKIYLVQFKLTLLHFNLTIRNVKFSSQKFVPKKIIYGTKWQILYFIEYYFQFLTVFYLTDVRSLNQPSTGFLIISDIPKLNNKLNIRDDLTNQRSNILTNQRSNM